MSEGKELMDAVLTVIAAVERSPGPVVTERELVQSVIEFANSATITGVLRHVPGLRGLPINGEMYIVITDELRHRSEELKKELAASIRGDLPGPTVARLRKSARRMVLVPNYEIERGTLQTKYRHLPADLDAVLAYILLLLRDHGEGMLGADLKQCVLPGCGRIFLASDQVVDPSAAGRRRHRYCSPEHMAAGQTSGAERTRKWRENKAKKSAAAAKHK
jgi:hypothetical protein